MKVRLIEKKNLLNSFFQVDVATLQYEKFKGGWSEAVRRYNLERGEAVAVLIYLQDRKRLVLIRQFRYAVYTRAQNNGWIEEIVAGVMDEGETPLQTAKRECLEETGYNIRKFESIAAVFSSPGITTERVHLFIGYATSEDKISEGGGLDSEHEDIELIELSAEEVREKILAREFTDAKTLLALNYFLLFHGN